MKNNIVVFLSVLLLTFFLVNCNNSKPKTKKFVYEIEDSKVEMKIENGKDFLYYGTPTKTDFIMYNIDRSSLSVIGGGIRIVDIDEERFKTEINVPENYFDNDTLNITIIFKKNGKKFKHIFLVPLKIK
jgi:hypothetical protein